MQIDAFVVYNFSGMLHDPQPELTVPVTNYMYTDEYTAMNDRPIKFPSDEDLLDSTNLQKCDAMPPGPLPM